MTTAPSATRPLRDEARFYPVDGRRWPSVTTILSVIAKPGLGPWYAKEERRHFEPAMLEVASRYRLVTGEQLLDAVIQAVAGVKAADREKQRAAAIGTAVHAAIEWETRSRLGEDPGPRPRLPEAAVWAVEAWKDWAARVGFRPLAVERTVYCAACGYAGTLDWLAEINGVLTLGDIKTSRAIHAEAFLQNIAYRHAAAGLGLPSVQGLIVRLPKVVDDPAFEVQWVPETVTLDDFLAALRLWRWTRQMAGRSTGDEGSGHHDADPARDPAAAIPGAGR
jgi:hypothetical protein